MPATCPTSLTTGTYPVNGTGYGLASTTISGVFNVIGLIQLPARNSIAISASAISNTGTTSISASGTYTLGTNCSATATLTDAAGNSYTLVFEFTSGSGDNFIFSSATGTGLYTGTGRSL